MDAKELFDNHVKFQRQRSYARIIKGTLCPLEELLAKSEPDSLLSKEFPAIRKRILDTINDEVRNLEALWEGNLK